MIDLAGDEKNVYGGMFTVGSQGLRNSANSKRGLAVRRSVVTTGRRECFLPNYLAFNHRLLNHPEALAVAAREPGFHSHAITEGHEASFRLSFADNFDRTPLGNTT